ncbi:MAG: glycosyl transferase [Oscillospiraceae bacterium]|nr:glycosyl transferase [Oscillospiraceae bacterium]
MSIPKIIHYCWFGNKPLPASCRKMIATWEKYLPDYEIRRWDETTFDITSSEYVRAAYQAGKYAFVSDYARLCALKEYGGIYLDTDIEVIRSFDDLLSGYSAVFGFESGEKVMTAFMAARPEHPIILEFLSRYAGKAFDAAAAEPNTVLLTDVLTRRGLVLQNRMQRLDGDTAVFPLDYFQAYDFSRAALCVTDHTCTIHRCFGSWCSPKERLVFSTKRVLGKCLSEEGYSKLKSMKKKIMGE